MTQQRKSTSLLRGQESMATYSKVFPPEQGKLFADVLRELGFKVMTEDTIPDYFRVVVFNTNNEDLNIAWELFQEEWRRIWATTKTNG